MRKVLLTATVLSHIAQFHNPLIKMLQENGDEVHVAAKNNLSEKNGLKLDTPDRIFDIPFDRSPLSKNNLIAYKELKRIINENQYDIVHCNTPMGGIVTRLATKGLRKYGTKVIYTAHGFHFYKGAPLKNWIMFYPIEKNMASITDDLITITTEDNTLANHKKFRTNVHHVHGVGVNSKRYRVMESEEYNLLRQKYNCENMFVILCTGELNLNKNQSTIIKAMPDVLKKYPNTVLYIAGNGPMKNELEHLILSLGLKNHVELLGYRTDLEKFVNMSDIVVSASIREGLPLNIMEAMICGKPVVASNNRGHNELIKEGKTGFIVSPTDSIQFANRIIKLLDNDALRRSFGEKAIKCIKPYDVINVMEELKLIYQKYSKQ
ncbi:glycosyltransferase family 4 protein [Bacillus tianshenii]|uniref:glycosyltransferase family 4 protein n=1 Tax=Sutcliffiella tianshenii TaxID=1463404 RepID=UPI001CD1D827|nr:glycosyltransferase family 4 protein [Bacillus tianshenii]MCA1320226.1 glycosyltransferase family 4 protein [Bacillus tianshenii]